MSKSPSDLIKGALVGVLASGIAAATFTYVTAEKEPEVSASSTLSSMPLEFGLMKNRNKNVMDRVIPASAPATPASTTAEWVGAGPDFLGAMPVLHRMQQGQTAYLTGMAEAFDEQNGTETDWQIKNLPSMEGLEAFYYSGYEYQTENGLSAGDINNISATTSDLYEKNALRFSAFVAETFNSRTQAEADQALLATGMAFLSGARDASGETDNMVDAQLLTLRDKITGGNAAIEAALDDLQAEVHIGYEGFFQGDPELVATVLNENLQRGEMMDFYVRLADDDAVNQDWSAPDDDLPTP
ncbi:MAG: hypothetical protein ABJN42_24920 [Roseibium sp.]|uniref:hypothetical protein n=1 Tax=Roseibium sp. TaxID=1936156 RepID=UPI00329A42CF